MKWMGEEAFMPEHMPKIKEEALVSKLVHDPKNPPNTLLLSGFVGKSSEEGHTRLYFDPQLSDYVEIPNAAILHTQEIPKDQSPLGGTYVWIQRDAALTHGKAGDTNRPKAKFLEGRIQQAYAKAAGASPAVPAFTQVCHPTAACGYGGAEFTPAFRSIVGCGASIPGCTHGKFCISYPGVGGCGGGHGGNTLPQLGGCIAFTDFCPATFTCP
jgi:hypothetical protein